MAKRSRKQKHEVPVREVNTNAAPCWAVFFRDQRSPFLRSQLITALMSGHPLELERLTNPVLADVLLLASTTRNYFEAEIIDDWEGLLRKVEEVWKNPMWTRRT